MELESARHQVVNLIAVADELRQRSEQARTECRDIVWVMLTKLQVACEPDDPGSDATARQHAYEAARRELQSNWLRLDMLIDDLLSSASDELVKYATHAESVVGKCEREVLHEARRQNTNRSRHVPDRPAR